MKMLIERLKRSYSLRYRCLEKLKPTLYQNAHCSKTCRLISGQSKFKRVAETGWRIMYYTTIWLVGVYVLRDQPQWSDLDASWLNYPFHPINDSVWWYYIVQTGFYWSLLFG